LASSLTVVALAAGIVLAPSPAMASGGGCIDHSNVGWNVGVCSSDNGVSVYGDIYVNRRGSLGSSCYIRFEILQHNVFGWVPITGRTDGCYAGRHSRISVRPSSGTFTFMEFHTSMRVVVNGATVNNGWSPLTELP
jgi:hypothetical protein